MKKMSHGFTLLELSIVLVVIGALAGGIVVGQTMIRNSQMQATLTEYAQYKQAAQAFRDKYIELPGDFSRASSIWTGETNGDGDGWINGITAIAPQEQFLAWRHLGLAQLLDGNYSGTGTNRDRLPGSNVPQSKLSGAGWGLTSVTLGNVAASSIPYTAPDMPPGHVLWLGGAAAANSNAASVTYQPILSTEEAYNLDTKTDDGLPNTGKIVSQEDTSCAADSAVATPYTTTVKGLRCSLIFKTGF